MAEPFFKWLGGKRRLIPHLRVRLPPVRGRLFEPFAGSAALSLAWGGPCVIGDVNPVLVACLRAVRSDVESVIEALRERERLYGAAAVGATPAARLAAAREYFLAARDFEPSNDIERAVRFLFVVGTGFNGLWRVNRSGKVNTAVGKRPSGEPIVTFLRPALLREASAALQHAVIREGDFEATVEDAVEGDAVYFDPPYMPLSPSASFTAYAPSAFGRREHARLCACALRLQARGVDVLVSNSDTSESHALYPEPVWEVASLSGVRRSIACTGNRQPVGELLARPRRPMEGHPPVPSLPLPVVEQARVHLQRCACGCFTCSACELRWLPEVGWEPGSPPVLPVPLPCPTCGGASTPSIISASARWASNACKARGHRRAKTEGRALSREERRRLGLATEAKRLNERANDLDRQARSLTQEAHRARQRAVLLAQEADGQLQIPGLVGGS